ncbi:MAG TPA: glycerol-3-phosphate 1-O-acyltransferase PlsY, partial [Acidobacteriota bacterium]|nr:glycerol-3-phosphate 1-O-acyltransferase PlsY [Acidobacteriota bacterium]
MKVLFIVLSYLLGAVPTGYLAYRLSERRDIREHGSRSTGATNVMRLKGWKLAVPVVVVDVLKGFLPAFLAVRLFGDPRLALVASFLAVAGHCYPIYIRFRGGKGVATTVGAATAVGFVPLLLCAAVFLVVVGLTRYVSLGSILAVTAFPVLALILGAGAETALWGAAIAAL